jgi:ribosomal protein S8
MSRLANSIAIIRSGLVAKKLEVKVQLNKRVIMVLKKFQIRGLINGYVSQSSATGGVAKVYLKYDENNEPVITYLRMLPEGYRTGWRYRYKDLKNIFFKNGLEVLLTTDKGFLFSSEIIPDKSNIGKIGGRAILILSIY